MNGLGMSNSEQYIVRADAICGAGKKLVQGDRVTSEVLGPFLNALLRSGAIAPVTAENSDPSNGIKAAEREV